MAIFGRGSAHNGRSMLYPGTLDIDIKYITKFHQDRIKVHGVMLWTDRHTDRQAGRRHGLSLYNCILVIQFLMDQAEIF